MKSTAFGYTHEQLSDIVCQMLLSGQGATPQKLFEVDVPEQGAERLRKALKASELFLYKSPLPKKWLVHKSISTGCPFIPASLLK